MAQTTAPICVLFVVGQTLCYVLLLMHHPIAQMSKLRLRDIKEFAHGPTGGDRMMIQTEAGPRAEQSDE